MRDHCLQQLNMQGNGNVGLFEPKKRIDLKLKINRVCDKKRQSKEQISNKENLKQLKFEQKIALKRNKNAHCSIKNKESESSILNPKVERMLTQLANALEKNEKKSDQQFSICSLSYDDFIQILHRMHLVRHLREIDYKIDNSECEKNELQKIFSLWTFYRELLKSSIEPLAALIKIISVVLKIDIANQEDRIHSFMKSSKLRGFEESDLKFSGGAHNDGPKHIFFVGRQKFLNLINKEQNKKRSGSNNNYLTQLSKDFELFRLNRLAYAKKNIPASNQQGNQQGIHSKIDTQDSMVDSLLSPRSQQLALQKRLKIIREFKEKTINQVCSNSDLDANQDLLNVSSIEIGIQDLYFSYKSPSHCESRPKSRNQIDKQKKKLDRKGAQLRIQSEVELKPKTRKSTEKYIASRQRCLEIKEQNRKIIEKGWACKSSATNSIKCKTESRQVQKSQLHESKSKCLKDRFSDPLKSDSKSLKNQDKHIFDVPLEGLCREKQYLLSERELTFEESEQLNVGEKTFEQPTTLAEDPINPVQDPQFSDEGCIEPSQGLTENIDQQQQLQSCNPNDDEGLPECIKGKITEEAEPIEATIEASKQQKKHQVVKSYLRIPILYVDVNINESQKERIVIYQQDDPSELAALFAQKHNLAPQMTSRLSDMLREQVNGILGRIEEEPFEEEQEEESSQLQNDRDCQQKS